MWIYSRPRRRTYLLFLGPQVVFIHLVDLGLKMMMMMMVVVTGILSSRLNVRHSDTKLTVMSTGHCFSNSATCDVFTRVCSFAE